MKEEIMVVQNFLKWLYSWKAVQLSTNTLIKIYLFLVYIPLYQIYLGSPTYFGGWHGKQSTEICASLTNVSEKFWNSTPETKEQCSELIHRQFQSIHIFFAGITYFLTLFFLVFKLFQTMVNKLVG